MSARPLIISGPHYTNRANEVPREQWPLLADERAHFVRSRFPTDCRALLFFVKDGEANDRLGYGSRDDYLRELGLDPEILDLASRCLQIISRNEGRAK
jgi:hypothetical protein